MRIAWEEDRGMFPGERVVTMRIDGLRWISMWKAEDGDQWYSNGWDPEDREMAELVSRYPHLAEIGWDRDYGSRLDVAKRNAEELADGRRAR